MHPPAAYQKLVPLATQGEGSDVPLVLFESYFFYSTRHVDPYQDLGPLTAPREGFGAPFCPIPRVGAPHCTKRGAWCTLLSNTKSWRPSLHQERGLVHPSAPYSTTVQIPYTGGIFGTLVGPNSEVRTFYLDSQWVRTCQSPRNASWVKKRPIYSHLEQKH